MNMRVDVVTGPVRYRSTPLFALIGVALIPVVLLAALLIWSDAEADAHELATDGESVDQASASLARPPSPQLITPMIDYRRAPARVASVSDDNQFSMEMDQLYAFVGEQSCAAVAVDGRIVSTKNVTVPVIPASTHKLLVAAVALEVLGPEYRFSTSVTAPPAVEGVVDGDVHLVGGGDPLLTSDDYPIGDDRYPAFNTTSLGALADAVVAAGITSIRGSILGDGSRYDDEHVNPTWAPGIGYADAGPIDALVANDGRTLGRTGRQRDPATTAARELARLLAVRGVGISNGSDAGAVPEGEPVIASVQSAPLTDVVTEMLTTSDNDTAEMLLKELGFADSGVGSLAAGLNVVDRTLRTWNVPMEGVRLADASGLSSDNRLTCAAVLAVLDRGAATLPAAMAVAGRTGTLAGEFVGSAVEGRLVAKTGTLGNPPVDVDPPEVKGLAGYLPTDTGQLMSFVLLLNAPGVAIEDGYLPFWDALAPRLAAYPAGGDLSVLGPR